MLMNIVLVYASLSATTDKKVSGQNADWSGPARHRLLLIACERALSRASRLDKSSACRPGVSVKLIRRPNSRVCSA